MVYVKKKKETLENRDKAEKHGGGHVYFPLSFLFRNFRNENEKVRKY